MSVYIRAVTAASRALGALSMVLLGVAVLVVCQMIFVRYVLNGSTVWQTEFVTYSLVAATFLASPYVLLLKGHVGVDLWAQAAGPRTRKALGIVSATVGLAFCVVLAWSGWLFFHEAWVGGWTTDTVWKLSLWIPLAPLPVGIGLLALQYVAEIMKIVAEPAEAPVQEPGV